MKDQQNQEMVDVTAENGTEQPDQNKGETQSEQQETKTKSFTELLQEDKNFQREFDRRVHQSIETARTKWEKEQKMTDDERAEQALKDREEAIAERERKQTLRERTADIRDALAEAGLPARLAPMIARTTEGDQEVLATIKDLQTVWQDGLKAELKAQVRQKDPVVTGQQQSDTLDLGAQLEEFARKNRKV